MLFRNNKKGKKETKNATELKKSFGMFGRLNFKRMV
jgi:hypothetical protein